MTVESNPVPLGTWAAYLVGLVYILPRIAARWFPQVWFCLTCVILLTMLYIMCFLVDKLRYLGVPRITTHGFCCWLAMAFFNLCIWLNPQMRVVDRGSNAQWSQVPKGAYVLANHTSFFDSFVITASLPTAIALRVRVIFKASLRKIPLFGPLFYYWGHFPVYYSSEDSKNFSVDRTKQEASNALLEKFLAAKDGYLVVFPEGVVNLEQPKLLPFRHGAFSLAIKHKIPLYAFLHSGNQVIWPPQDKVGGHRGTVTTRLVKLDVDYEAEGLTAKTLAESCQGQMQLHMDEVWKINQQMLKD